MVCSKRPMSPVELLIQLTDLSALRVASEHNAGLERKRRQQTQPLLIIFVTTHRAVTVKLQLSIGVLNEPVILRVRTDPEPDDIGATLDPQRPVVQPHPNR